MRPPAAPAPRPARPELLPARAHRHQPPPRMPPPGQPPAAARAPQQTGRQPRLDTVRRTSYRHHQVPPPAPPGGPSRSPVKDHGEGRCHHLHGHSDAVHHPAHREPAGLHQIGTVNDTRHPSHSHPQRRVTACQNYYQLPAPHPGRHAAEPRQMTGSGNITRRAEDPWRRLPGRGTAGDQPPQPDPVPPARHRRDRAAAADHPVQDSTRNGSWSSRRSWRTCCRPSSPGSASPAGRSRSFPSTTATNAYGCPRLGLVPAPVHQRDPGYQRHLTPGHAQHCRIRTGLKDTAGQPLHDTPHDFRRIFITDAVISGLPPHIAQVIAGHKDITTTMGYKAVYPDEAIRATGLPRPPPDLRPGEEYRVPTDAEWEAVPRPLRAAGKRPQAPAGAPSEPLCPRAQLLL